MTLTVTDGPGLTDTVAHTVTLAENTPPTAAFTFTCVDLGCAFDASGSIDNGPLTYAWDFGDGGTDTVVNPSHSFAAVGDHVVTLTVTDGQGLFDSVAQTVTHPGERGTDRGVHQLVHQPGVHVRCVDLDRHRSADLRLDLRRRQQRQRSDGGPHTTRPAAPSRSR